MLSNPIVTCVLAVVSHCLAVPRMVLQHESTITRQNPVLHPQALRMSRPTQVGTEARAADSGQLSEAAKSPTRSQTRPSVWEGLAGVCPVATRTLCCVALLVSLRRYIRHSYWRQYSLVPQSCYGTPAPALMMCSASLDETHHKTFVCKAKGCSKKFRSQDALTQHVQSAHSAPVHKHRPPFPGASGRWVPRQAFQGRKSFGHYRCSCGRCWGSAHAYPQYKQGCQSCDAETLPCCLWVNDQDAEDRDVEEPNSDQPHDRERCEACRLGICDMV